MRTKPHNKKRKIDHNDYQITSETTRDVEDVVPRDLVIEILRRLPVKDVTRFLVLSKSWAKTIRSKDFIRSFPLCSPLHHQPEPHMLFALKYLDTKNGSEIWELFSSSTVSTVLKRLSYLSLATCPKRLVNEIPHHVNGLISFGCGREQIICNPSTRKSITLPKVKSRKKTIKSFFGYDPVGGEYKVLCMSQKSQDSRDRLDISYEHQVFTLGNVSTSWNMIECNILHRPKTNGVCINGVVYYGAITMKMWCLVRFDVRSENFDQVVEFLGDQAPCVRIFPSASLINYKGKATLVTEIEPQRFELWILEDAKKHEWSKVRFVIRHSLIDLLGPNLRFRGYSNHTDEFMLVSHDLEYTYVVYYQQKNNSLTAFRDNGQLSPILRPFADVFPLFNYEESVMLL